MELVEAPVIDIFNGIDGLDISILDKDKPVTTVSTDKRIPTEEDLLKTQEITEPEEGKDTKKPEDKEIKEPEDKSQEAKKPEEPKKPEELSPYRVFAQLLNDQGSIRTIPEDFQESDEGINALIEKEVENRKQEWIDSFPEDIKYFIENHKQGVPFSELLQAEATIQDYESIDKEKIKDNESIQKSIITDYLTSNGWTKEEILEEIAEFETSGTLESKSKRYLNKLIQDEKLHKEDLREQSQEAQRQTIEKYKAQVEGLRQTLKEKAEIIPGIKLTDKDRKTMFDGVTKFDSSNKNAYMRYKEKNPDIDLTSVYLALVLNNDFTKLDKAAFTKAAKTMADKLDGKEKVETLKGVDMSVIRNALNTIKF